MSLPIPFILGFIAEKLARKGCSISAYNLAKGAAILDVAQSIKNSGNCAQVPFYGGVPANLTALGLTSAALDIVAMVGFLAGAAAGTALIPFGIATLAAVAVGAVNPENRKIIEDLLESFGLDQNAASKVGDFIYPPSGGKCSPFGDAKRYSPSRDPIILDLDGDGLETVGLASNIHFDHDGDGVLTKTGWVGEHDALLVWDRNANGSIDTGAELFGDFTELPNGTLAPNGFAALAALDVNGDEILDATDSAFSELKLWRDTSQDGYTGEGELITLADAGIASLNLANILKNQRLSNGNTLSRESSFMRTDGTTGGMGEFRLTIDTFHTRFAEDIEIPESLKTLPNMGGSGNVRELWRHGDCANEEWRVAM